jgi:transposase
LEQNISLTQVAHDLGININTLSIWKRKYLDEHGGISSCGKEPQSIDDYRKRVKALEKELLITREEREVLKKAVSFFASPR